MVSTRHLVTLATAAIGGVAITMAAVPAHANTFSSTELTYDDALLSQFNLVTLNAYTNTSSSEHDVAGRAIVGSVSTTSTIFCNSNCSGNATSAVDSTGQTYSALTVFGNASGIYGTYNGTTSVGGTATGSLFENNTGNAKFKASSGVNVYFPGAGGVTTGSAASTVTLNNNSTGATVTGNASPASVFPFTQTALTTQVKDLYSGLANLPGSPGVTMTAVSGLTGFTSGTYTGTCTGGSCNYGVVATTLANFEANTPAAGIANGSGDKATFVIITDTGGGSGILPTITTANPDVIYDFVSSASLTINSTFDGTILAPLASFTVNGTLNGTTIVNSLNNLGALSDTNAFTGDLSGLNNFTYNARVPEPASIAMFGSGMAGLAWLRRKRKK